MTDCRFVFHVVVYLSLQRGRQSAEMQRILVLATTTSVCESAFFLYLLHSVELSGCSLLPWLSRYFGQYFGQPLLGRGIRCFLMVRVIFPVRLLLSHHKGVSQGLCLHTAPPACLNPADRCVRSLMGEASHTTYMLAHTQCFWRSAAL